MKLFWFSIDDITKAMKTLDKKNETVNPLDGDLRRFSAVPIRACQDKRLSINDHRVLLVLCAYTNKSGVCFPTYETMENIIGLGKSAIQASIKRLEGYGILRHLKPVWYPNQKSPWKTNRYQILYLGSETPIPTDEELRDARAYNIGQDDGERDDSYREIGQIPKNDQSHIERDAKGLQLFNSFNRILNQFGSNAIYSTNQITANRLAENGLTPDQVSIDTVAYIKANLARTGTIPTSMSIVFPIA
jgi:hypothetical protein